MSHCHVYYHKWTDVEYILFVLDCCQGLVHVVSLLRLSHFDAETLVSDPISRCQEMSWAHSHSWFVSGVNFGSVHCILVQNVI